MGAPLIIGIVIYLLLIIALTAWFLRIHAQKNLTDGEHQAPLPSETGAVNLENPNDPAAGAYDKIPSLRSTETDLLPKKK